MTRGRLSRGVIYMIVSALAFSIMSMLVKVVSERVPTGEIVLARSVITLVLSYAMVRRAQLSIWGHEKRKLMLRGLFGFCGLSGYYTALALLPIADATTIQNTSPILTTLLAWWLLRERLGWPTLVALVCGIGGVLVIVKPGGVGLDPMGVMIAVGCSVCLALASVTIRVLAKTEHPLVIVMYFPLVATPLAIPWAAMNWVTPSPTDLLLLLAIGATTQIGQVYLTMALTVEKAGVTAVGYMQVVFAMIWQAVIFMDAPAITTIIGAAMITGGTIVMTQLGAGPRMDGATA